jgi:hypothetical protein
MQLSDERLTTMALIALEEVAVLCEHEPMKPSRALRLVLAYLASRQPCDRRFFDAFWRAVRIKRPRDRSAIVHGSLNGIYRQVGRRRDTAIISRYEQAARKRLLADEAAVPVKESP